MSQLRSPLKRREAVILEIDWAIRRLTFVNLGLSTLRFLIAKSYIAWLSTINATSEFSSM